MKKAMIIIGVLLLVACVIFALCAIFNNHGYHNIYDGAPSLYDRLHRKTVIYSVTSALLAVIGTLIMIIQSKIK